MIYNWVKSNSLGIKIFIHGLLIGVLIALFIVFMIDSKKIDNLNQEIRNQELKIELMDLTNGLMMDSLLSRDSISKELKFNYKNLVKQYEDEKVYRSKPVRSTWSSFSELDSSWSKLRIDIR